MEGKLFSQDFLQYGITETPPWREISDERLAVLHTSLQQVFSALSADSSLNEANTESQIIEKVLDLLGWGGLTLRQVTANAGQRQDVPDFLLFADPAAKQAALQEQRQDRCYRHGVAILEAKRWMRPLDRGDAADRLDPGTPSNQILRYLSTVEVASDRKIRWGILTNGARWRLYWQGARSRAEEFLEIDLAALMGVPGTLPGTPTGEPGHDLRLFFVLFRREAFLPQDWDPQGRTFHEYALDEARLYEDRVSRDLGSQVFDTIFPRLAAALAHADPQADLHSPAYLEALRDATLVLLYRLLFILYAEDRNLLPVRDRRYDDYALRRIREEIARRCDAGDTFSATAGRYWQHLCDLFHIIAEGDSSIGMPAYNGGLFEPSRAPLLDRVKVPDAHLAPLLDALSRRVGRDDDSSRAWINYRDLSVQHLGGIYERLLEYRLVVEDEILLARPSSFARKTSGSYYTHDDLVKRIIEETVGPLVRKKREIFLRQLESWAKKRALEPEDWRLLDRLDPASALLTLRICDPAMGSGHFLVSLVDWMADVLLEIMAEAEQLVAHCPWAKDIANPWVSPLVARLRDIRQRILAAAHEHGWTVDEAQLDDRHLVRRMILKRVVHGVDKNPMAVELAKVALWLHTFTAGAPLSFLDHHLRCGDSLFGGRVEHISQELRRLQGGLLQQADLQRVEQARMTMIAIGDLTDIDIAEAHYSKALMAQIEEGLRPLWLTLDFLMAWRWASPHKQKDFEQTWADLLAQEYGEDLLDSVLMLTKVKPANERQQRACATLRYALEIARRERFFHWELAFPTVFSGAGAEGCGFDALIGNPPWDRIKLQEVEWFAERRPEIARAARAADRKRLIEALCQAGDPLWQEYLQAQESAETAARVARTCGEYPLMSGGDINLYSLFVERASRLIHGQGLVGLLTPSGIAADKGASAFFRTLSQSGRLAVLFDFENKKAFFPDIHASFKFCILVFGGEQRRFTAARCAFYLHRLEELDDPERVLELTADDFAAVNPNTGAAPIFRTRRDAGLVTAIYRRQPVLVRRFRENGSERVEKVWPVRYCTMFHMTNDSHLFRRREELEADGWYPVPGNRWKKGEAEAVPLYEGKMVQMYDHRAASVLVNPQNLHRPAQPVATTLAQHQDPDFSPTPQFWVEAKEVRRHYEGNWVLGFKEITAPTNIRTMISAIIPFGGYGNTLPILIPDRVDSNYSEWATQLLANFNTFIFDYLVRQKVQGQHLNWYIVEQLPMIRPEQFEQTWGTVKLADFIRGEVLRLSYTAWDLAPFARDLGYQGPPFLWDEEDRRHRMARLDAVFFRLYGLDRQDADYVLERFPIVREHDEREFGRYRTKDLILGYLNAVAAGDFTSQVKA